MRGVLAERFVVQGPVCIPRWSQNERKKIKEKKFFCLEGTVSMMICRCVWSVEVSTLETVLEIGSITSSVNCRGAGGSDQNKRNSLSEKEREKKKNFVGMYLFYSHCVGQFGRQCFFVGEERSGGKFNRPRRRRSRLQARAVRVNLFGSSLGRNYPESRSSW